MSFKMKKNIMIMEVSKTRGRGTGTAVLVNLIELLSMNISKILIHVPIFQAPF